jgi:ribonuclease E
MRLRDLGGLIVIDFIDMEESKQPPRSREPPARCAAPGPRPRAVRHHQQVRPDGDEPPAPAPRAERRRFHPLPALRRLRPHPRHRISALQILRIIQEESLKDSTASVLCQVPVEVASFLLNEKRTEIAKIELKQRINVLLVPNKTLETPNYKLERLKHDDPRLDNIEASYKMADEPRTRPR